MKFQWLKDYQELSEQLTYLKWNLNKSKLELIRWVDGDLSKIKLKKNSRAASLEDKIRIIGDEITLLEDQMKEAYDIFESFDNIDSQILRLKYIDHCTLDEIAEELGYSHSYIRKRHADISKSIKFLENYQDKKQERLERENEIEYYQDELNMIEAGLI
ncbi:sigma factor-like helix-turn-helix DNA-binding protein [Enterococcus sp. AZ196]|uniref:sigma factor-like helix-turn-helix DNA-binding protein n=1 Tax=Enterococcus sp. AZ196 TaxID=2774659 RepID=UPI003D2B0FF6